MKRTFSQFFIDHPRTAWVAAIVLVLCGGLCFSRMAVSEYPNITPVTISVSANYTGASAEVTIDTVAQVIEDQINAVEDIWYYKSNGSGRRACCGAASRSRSRRGTVSSCTCA